MVSASSIENGNGSFSPFKATLYALVVALAFRPVATMITGTVVVGSNGIDLNDPLAINSALATSQVFLVANLVLTAILIVLAGKLVKRYAAPIHLRVVLWVGAVTVGVSAYAFYVAGTFTVYPLWYTACLFIVRISGLFPGCIKADQFALKV